MPPLDSPQTELELHVRRNSGSDVDDTTVERQPSMLAAIKLCIQTAGLQDNQVAPEIGMKEGQFSRCMSGNAHFPPNKLNQLMDLCGNEIPLRWLALSRGYGLVRLKSAVEIELEQARAVIAKQHQELQTIKQFVKETS